MKTKQQHSGVFQKGDVVMRKPAPFQMPLDESKRAQYQETGLVIKASPTMKKPRVAGAQTTYDAQDIEILWGVSGEVEARTTVFNNLLLIDPNTGLPENVFINGGWKVKP